MFRRFGSLMICCRVARLDAVPYRHWSCNNDALASHVKIAIFFTNGVKGDRRDKGPN